MKCTTCSGRGHIELFTSTRVCETCAGSGKAPEVASMTISNAVEPRQDVSTGFYAGWQQGATAVYSNMPTVRPDPRIGTNMPTVGPDPRISVNMPTVTYSPDQATFNAVFDVVDNNKKFFAALDALDAAKSVTDAMIREVEGK